LKDIQLIATGSSSFINAYNDAVTRVITSMNFDEFLMNCVFLAQVGIGTSMILGKNRDVYDFMFYFNKKV